MKATFDSIRLGFGCAGVPGRLTKREALTLLETAYACGIRHFDTAAMYGWGASEVVLGELVRQCGPELTIVTKAGIAPPTLFTRASKKLKLPTGRRDGRFAPDQVNQSVETSLRKLKLDCVDALLLHEIRTHEISDDLKVALQRLRAAGKIASWGIATSVSESEAIIAVHPELCDIVQVPAAWLDQPRTLPPNARLVVHSVLGARLEAFTEALSSSERARRFKEETGLSAANTAQIGRLMLQGAMLRNAGGVTLFSTCRPERIRLNAELLTAKLDTNAVQSLEQALRAPDNAPLRVAQ
jgi:D-threo-aldose 1-dehydrogenase